MFEKRFSRPVQITVFIVFILSIVILITYKIWVPKVIVLYTLHELHEKNLETHIVSTPLKGALPKGTSYIYKTLTLQVPWPKQVVNENKDSTIFSVSFAPTSTERAKLVLLQKDSLYVGLIGNDPKNAAYFNIQPPTNFETYKQVISINPSDINVSTSSKIFLPKLSLLLLKAAILPTWDGTIRSFENTYDIRGFETALTATSTSIELFTPNDQEYTLLITNATTEEIDQILQSIREI